MLGIISFGAYIPFFRLSRDEVAKAWGRRSLGGERSVANNDEDTATMAVEACFDCLRGVDRKEINGLFFASTTPPYAEKQIASLVATVVDLQDEIFTADYGNCLRSGTSAMKMAYHIIKGGGAKNLMVTATDSRIGYPKSDDEQSFGDGAAALIIGEGPVIATVLGSYTISHEMMDVWRTPEDTYVKSWESRWVLAKGYNTIMQRAIQGILKRCGLKTEDIHKAVLPAPDLRTHKGIITRAGFQDSQAQDPLINAVGNCGTAQPLMMLVDALDHASPGDKILMAAYGDGADAFVFQVTENIKNLPQRLGVSGHLESKHELLSYERYLSYRGLLEPIPGEPFRLLPSATVSYRDKDSVLRLYGSRCMNCGTSAFPIQRVCNECRSKDNFEKICLSERKGKVFSYNLDQLAGRSDDPVVPQIIMEVDALKTRFYGMMTDCIPSEVKIGIPVEFTFRRLYEGAGFHNYFWKVRPIRNGGK